VRKLWAAPATLLGLLLSTTFDRRFVCRGIILAEGARWPRRLGWRYRAITLGHVVLATQEVDEKTTAHELVHVRQFERWGPLLFVLYPLASLAAVLKGGHHYRDNLFEIQAQRAG
jgi:hypothetical protein